MFRRLFAPDPTSGLSARPALLCVGLLDELVAGFFVVALPLLHARLGVSYAQIGLLFTMAALSTSIVDPWINLVSDRHTKKIWIIAGMLVLTVTDMLIGNVTSYLCLLLAFLVNAPALSVAVGLAEASLIDDNPSRAIQTMTRWTLLSGIGDFLSPLAVAVVVALGLGWTALCWFAALLWLLAAGVFLPLRFPGRTADADEDGSQERLWVRLRQALRDPLLLRWAALALLPTMLDEVFLGFVSLYLHDVLLVSESVIAVLLTLQMIASFLSLFLLDRWLKHRPVAPVRLLFCLALVTLAGVICLLTVHALWGTVLALLVIACSCAGWYPLAQAEAYGTRPANSGLVRAVIGLGAPLEVALPGVIGLIAAGAGLLTGLAVLGLAPVLVLLLLPYGKKAVPDPLSEPRDRD